MIQKTLTIVKPRVKPTPLAKGKKPIGFQFPARKPSWEKQRALKIFKGEIPVFKAFENYNAKRIFEFWPNGNLQSIFTAKKNGDRFEKFFRQDGSIKFENRIDRESFFKKIDYYKNQSIKRIRTGQIGKETSNGYIFSPNGVMRQQVETTPEVGTQRIYYDKNGIFNGSSYEKKDELGNLFKFYLNTEQKLTKTVYRTKDGKVVKFNYNEHGDVSKIFAKDKIHNKIIQKNGEKHSPEIFKYIINNIAETIGIKLPEKEFKFRPPKKNEFVSAFKYTS